jgi:transcriptional regulator with XRE-family HTH domain
MVNMSHSSKSMSERKGVAVRPISEHERYRRLRGHSITSLAAAIGRSRLWVSRIENGHEQPSAGYRRDVARVLEVPEDLIFTKATNDDGAGSQEVKPKTGAAT